MQLNEAVSRRLVELMQERGMTQYQLYMKSGVPKSTIGNLVNCVYPSTGLPDGLRLQRQQALHPWHSRWKTYAQQLPCGAGDAH